MANKPLRPCACPGCGVLVKDRYCDRHRPAYLRGESAQWHWMYNTPAWKQLRNAHLVQHPWCAECANEGKRVRASVVDHIQPHRGAISLFLDPKNLQSLCKSHHDRKTLEERTARALLAHTRG